MPIYEYQCSKCGHQLEAFQSLSEAPLTLCPKCDQHGLNKLISNTSFQLKGSGWYKTDYEKKPAPAAESKPTDTATKETKTDSASSGEQKNNTSTTTDKKTDTKAG